MTKHHANWPGTLSRRSAITTVAAASLTPRFCASVAASDDVAHLIERAAAKNAAFMRGDMDRWLALVRIASDFTLMQPFGGPTSHGFDASPERLAKLSQFFKNGETTLEVMQTYASDKLVVLVMVERQYAEVGSLPKQDWSLRVTEIYRKDGSEWQLVHRHADPLVHGVTLQEAATIARGGRKDE
ncbi:nuclear transport factor 2 family protein [Bradyrhizobium sp. 151]|uniref:YybH family protein n=1 Tax=Bradyrhizobium sp. 151 TaxID=2782626 RepID=UPI001FFBC063|nr:nuclear transport factor 2 family protein [Bradyrhizobium sp. 151]